MAAEVVPDQDFRPSHTDITQGRTWLDPEYNNNRMVQAWSSLEGEIFVGRFNLDITLIDESVRTLHGGPARADALSQPDVGEFIGGTVVSFGAGGRAYMALRQGEEWPVVQLVDQETGASDFDWVWPSASPNAASYMFLYQRNQEFRLAEVTDFRTGAYVDWGSLGFRNVDGASTPGGIQSLASPRFVPGSRRVVSPVVADHATGRTEIRLYGFPDTRPEEGVLPFVVLELSIFDEVNAFRAAGWPGSTVLVSHSADQRSWEFRLLDHTLPIGEVDGANLPIVHRVTNPNPEIWGTSIRNSEPIEIGDRSFFMFISKEDGRPTPGTLGVNHLWIAEIAQGETWVRKVDDIPAGGNDLFVTDPEWSGGGEVLTAFDREGHLYAFPTGITRVACETPPGRHPRRRLRPVVGVSLQPTAATVAVGGTQAFAATVTGTANQAVDWSVQEGPSGGTISSVGLYVAPAEVGPSTSWPPAWAIPTRAPRPP